MQPKTKNLRLKIIIGIVGWIFIVLVTIVIIGKAALKEVSELRKQPSSIDANNITQLEDLVHQNNARCPIMIDEYTRMDSITLLPAKHVLFNMTVGLKKEDINLDVVKPIIDSAVINDVRNMPVFEAYRQFRTTIVYFYKDREGMFLFSVKVTPDEYQVNNTTPPLPPNE